ncbi:MAG: ATP-binding protein [Fusobacteriaceae bacterium]|jgi:predicted AAA+ superfamily ATPase|nr:ATP-binding protein [Fusobacteriaceae bacterium]
MKARDAYLSVLKSFKDKEEIKIITGVRRCGKSSLLELFVEYLLASGVPETRIIRMNFESLRFSHIQNYMDLYRAVSALISGTEKHYILLDEVQMVENWARAIDSFRVDFPADIYITGSNSRLLSSDFATMLGGRCVEIKMYPLSFKEFLDFNDFESDAGMERKFESYLKYGGMPGIVQYNFAQDQINPVLEGIYSTIVLRDVVERNAVGDQRLLQKLVLFLADNIGSLVSPNSIGNAFVREKELQIGGKTKPPAGKTISSYIEALESAYIFYGVPRYDIRGKEYLKTLDKYYIVDTGIRNILLGYRDVNRGYLLENIVYFELRRRGYDVSVGKVGETEIDFIAVKPDEKIYYQVSESIRDEGTRKREIFSLQSAKDNYRKVILTMDRSFVNSYEGIEVKNLLDFLQE